MSHILLPVGFRLGRGVLVLFVVAAIVFVIIRSAPGDPAVLLLGPSASPETIAGLRASMGLDRPMLVQFLIFIRNLLGGDAGWSLVYQRPALDLVMSALPQTLLLSVASFALTLLVAVPAGVIAAVRHGRLADRIVRAVIILAQALPSFWIGIMLIAVFAVGLGWLPTSGNDTPMHIVLPAVTLCIYQLALVANVVRSSMLSVLRQDYIATARAKGLARGTIIRRHALINTALPVLTILALQLGAIISGSVITEAVFAWPGLGTLALNAVLARDYAVIQAVVLFSSALVVLLNVAVDALQVVLDPRLRG